MKTINNLTLSLLFICLSFVSQSSFAAIAGFNVPADSYGIFVRDNGFAEIRLKNNISTYTSVVLTCVNNNIIALGNSFDTTFNDTAMAVLLTAYSTKQRINILISDAAGDIDANNNCGISLVHLQCTTC